MATKALYAALISALGIAASATIARAQTVHVVDDASLKNAGKNGAEWTTYGFTQGETRYSPLDKINTTNVARLGLAWSYEIGKGGGNQEATPLELNGVIYSITNWSVVYAVDARTGKEKWRWDPQVNQDKTRPYICCGVVQRGIALYQNLVIAPIVDGRLIALNIDTGHPVWESRISYSRDGYTVTMAPRIAKGKVIIGVAGSELPIRGFFDAYDARTGQRAWRFYTVPGDPSKPYENPALKKAAETWSGDFWKLGGGGSLWDAISYDPEADLIYVGTGNGGPWPEALRQSKGKDNLYVASILAVKPDTGELKWYFQPVPGDSWDFDSVQQLLLADIVIRGQPRKVLMQANKDGFYYVIDRVTGQFISGQPFAKVTWAKGLDERSGRPFVNPEAHYEKETIQISPGPGGGHNWSPMSFNPSTGLVYIPASLSSSSTFAIDDGFTYAPGRSNTGIRRGPPPANGDGRGAPLAATLPPPPAIGPEAPPAGAPNGVLVAWDPATQKQRWQTPGGGSIGGGTVTTAGNLVIQVIPDGRLVAYSADKGEKLLDVKTGLNGGMGPPITYELDGKQYIALAGGQGIVVARNAEPGAPVPPPTATTVFPKLMVFVLDGKPLAQ
jgi:quinohemoprotein ethanol dehydrogenase